jgi:orotate phosphoribosyltransferase
MGDALTLAELTAVGAHRRGHFLLSSGLHSGDYLQCALYLSHPRRAEAAGARLAAALRDLLDERLDLVVSPALGGVIIGHETARALDLPFLFTERSGESMSLRRGFAVAPGQRAVVVEDVVTTGRSTREVIALLAAAGASVAAVASVVNRSGLANPFAPLPYPSLLAVSFPTWPPTSCQMCREGRPVDKPGSRPGSSQG